MTILEKINQVFRQVFHDEMLVVANETNASHIAAWDSFMHVNLIVALEEAFNVSFTTREIGSFGNVGDVIALLQQKGVPAIVP
jgi:acyl carrier protein